jgi:hypothetical protein
MLIDAFARDQKGMNEMNETLIWFSVHVEARASAGEPISEVDDASVDVFMDLLKAYDGVVGNSDRSWTATVSIEKPDPRQAVADAVLLIQSLAETAGMPAWPMVRAEAVRDDVLEADNARSTLPDLVSAPEAAEILRVSPQRLHEIADRRGFPKPVYELRTGKLWLRPAIEAFDRLWERKPGRPANDDLPRQKLIGALVDSGVTVAESKVSVGEDRRLMLQLQVSGSPGARRIVAARVIVALHDAGLLIAEEATRAADDMEGYLADGHPATVLEMRE